MKVVFITGQIGAGKSEVSKILRSEGKTVIDVDIIAKQVMKINHLILPAILGLDFIDVDNINNIDYAKVKKKIFSNVECMERLEYAIHPQVFRTMKDYVEFYAPILDCLYFEVSVYYESIWFENFKSLLEPDQVFIIDADENLRKERCRVNRGYTDKEFNERNLLQWPVEKKLQEDPKAKVINNDSSPEELLGNMLRAGIL